MKKQFLLLVIALTYSIYITAQIPIDNSYFAAGNPTYIWDSGNQYLITEDIIIPDGSDLIIDPGVEVLFEGDYKIDVLGSINANGTVDSRIIFTSSDPDETWKGIRFDFSDNPYPAASKLYNCDISNAQKTGTDHSSADPESSGGAIYIESFSNLEINGCNIFNNSVLSLGGAIGIFSYSNPVIQNCVIHDNYSAINGGGIAILKGSNPSLYTNDFYENKSRKGGGAIFIGPLTTSTGVPCYPNIWGNTIRYNSAEGIIGNFGNGGGIFIGQSNPSIINNTIEGNSAYSNGGGVYIQGTSEDVLLESNTFLKNIAFNDGGGLYCASTLLNPIYNCQFIENSAVNGGGIYLSYSELDITNSDFTANTASNHGGGIYVLNSASTIEKCTFEENTAINNGGGIFMNDPEYNSINLNKFMSNTAYHGSALYLYRNNSQTSNYQYPAKVLNNLFVENHTTVWGVVFLQGNNKALCHFEWVMRQGLILE